MSNDSPTRRSVVSTYLENLENLNQTNAPSSRGLHSRAKSLFENKSPQQVPISPSRTRSTLVTSSPSRSLLVSDTSSRPVLDSPTRLRANNDRSITSSPTRPSEPLELPSLPGSPIKPRSNTGTTSNSSQQGKAFDYLCRVSEAKEWIESIIKEEIPPVGSLIKDGLKDGVILAKLSKSLKPQIKDKITISKFQYHHTDNINIFFKLLDEVKMPNIFCFELNDLYEGRNIPKVIICLHALSAIVNVTSGLPTVFPAQGPFEEKDLAVANNCLKGLNFPNFESLNSQFKRELRGRNVVNFQPPKSSATLLNPIVLKPLNDSTNSSSPNKRKLKSPFLDDDVKKTTLSYDLSPISIPKLSPPPKIHKSPNSKALNLTRQISMKEEEKVFDLQKSPTRQRKLKESEFLQKMIQFQSFARGANTRYAFFIKKKMLDIWSENIIDLQAIARRFLIFKKLGKDSKSKALIEPIIIRLQAIIRGKFQKNQMLQQEIFLDEIINLQNIIRGNILREHIDRINFELFKHNRKIVLIQSKIRGKLIYNKISIEIQAQIPIISLQSISRRLFLEKKLKNSINISNDIILILQSIIRGKIFRNKINEQILKLEENDINELQCIIRGGLLRNKINIILDTLDEEDNKLNQFSAIIKGIFLRKNLINLKIELFKSINSIIKLQSNIRGVIIRYSYDLILDNFDFYSEDVKQLQSIIRGFLYRQSRHELLQYYEQFLPQIVKIQSYIRGKYLGNAYKSLISLENPPLSVIKKFQYLLIDNEIDIQEEVKLTKLKEFINERTNVNERLQRHIDQLNLKIELLEKNKIEFDEIHQFNNETNSSIKLSSLNLKSKQKIELFEKLFYLLQTQPSYLTKLIHCNSNDGVNIILKIFNNNSEGLSTREEYLFIKLIGNIIKDCIVKKNGFIFDQDDNWQILLNNFVTIYPSLDDIIENLIEDSQIDFEANPILIYNKIHGINHVKLSDNDVILEKLTRQKFIENLQNLRNFSIEILINLEESIESIPIFIKILIKIGYLTSLKKYPQYLNQEHLSIAGYIFIKGFLKTIISNQIEKKRKLTKINKSNLLALNKLLVQMFIMKPFNQLKEPYYQPLNRHIINMTDRIIQFLQNLIEIGGDDIDSIYQMTIYDDMISHKRPKLTLNILDMISIGEILKTHINYICPYNEDSLREILITIDTLKTPDLSELNGYYTLLLNPSIYKTNEEEIRIKSLTMELKRCVLYLMQVQDEFNDLKGLIEAPIDNVHEFKFKNLIDLENKKSSINEYGSLNDLNKISYYSLKKLTIEKILELQKLSYFPSSSFDVAYQTIINDIVNDIKSKNDQRQLRKRQLQTAENVLIRLKAKEESLTFHLQNYEAFIDKSMEILQTNSPRKRKTFPFTKQYFYERQLKKHGGRIPKFGAYKYSFKKLYEKGIITSKDSDLLTSSSFFTGISFPRIDFMFVSNEIGVFEISSKSYENSKISMNGFKEKFTLDQLLFDYQFENKDCIELFGGLIKFDTYAFVGFIFKKFYHSNQV